MKASSEPVTTKSIRKSALLKKLQENKGSHDAFVTVLEEVCRQWENNSLFKDDTTNQEVLKTIRSVNDAPLNAAIDLKKVKEAAGHLKTTVESWKPNQDMLLKYVEPNKGWVNPLIKNRIPYKCFEGLKYYLGAIEKL